MRQIRKKNTATRIPPPTAAQLFGLAVSLAVTAALLAGAAALISAGRLPEDSMRLVTNICAFLGALAGGLAAASRFEGRRLLAGCAAGAVMLLVYLGGALIGGDFGGRKLLQLAALIPGGALGGAASALGRARRH
ncbi:MAG: TIGR04086 family membrane protein [Oscillospiraceae bacterium]|jgi:putative membrane protein (TIGR04086 family)|nr:TIGR04086 family membrane protein [Oscillospiraceae bacterium]